VLAMRRFVVDPHIDRERDWVETDLLFAGTADGYVDIPRPAAPHKAGNATGDAVVTDGVMTVVDIGPTKAHDANATAPGLKIRQ
jgi:hypothetical protein